MFGKKKYSREELEQLELNLEQGNEILVGLAGKKDWFDSNYNHIEKSRKQMESDIGRITEHIGTASETAKRGSEITSSLAHELDLLKEEVDKAQEDYAKTTSSIEAGLKECQDLVEENKHYTTPSKTLSELPGFLRTCNTDYRESLALMSEQSKQMGVLALNAAIEAGRMGEQGRQFVTAAEEIRNYSKRYDEAAREFGEKLDAFDGKIVLMEEVIVHLIGMMRESNMGMAHLMKELTGLKKHVDGSAVRPFSEDVQKIREAVTELKNGSEEIIKSEERSRIQMDDVSEELENQKKSGKEVVGELQKLLDAAGLYVERTQKEEE